MDKTTTPTSTYTKACLSCNKPQSQVSGSECDRCSGTLCYTCCQEKYGVHGYDLDPKVMKS